MDPPALHAPPRPVLGTRDDRVIDALVLKALANLATHAEHHGPGSDLDNRRRLEDTCGPLLRMCRRSSTPVFARLVQELDRPMLAFGGVDDPASVVATLRHELSVMSIICAVLPGRSEKGTDPQPLEEGIIGSLFVAVTFFLQQALAFEREGGRISFTPSIPRLSSRPRRRLHQMSGPDSLAGVPTLLMNGILSRVAELSTYVGSTSWPTVIQRIRANLVTWSTSAAEVDADRVQLRLFEMCLLDQVQVGTTLQAFAGHFSHVKRGVQVEAAVLLRKSIWNWITSHSDEYAQLVAADASLEGAPDTLFDIADSISHEHIKRRSHLWPLQTMLLAVCPDILSKIARVEGAAGGRLTQAIARKANFLDQLRKTLRGSKLVDVAAACGVDLIKAATFAPAAPSAADNVGLLLVATDLIPDINAVLVASCRPLRSTIAPAQELLLTSEYIASLARLDRKHIDDTLLQRCLSESSQSSFQLSFIEACHMLAVGGRHAAWNASLADYYPLIASRLRKLFMLAVGRGLDKVATGSASAGSTFVQTGDQHSDRNELLTGILDLWRADPSLAFYLPAESNDPPLPHTDLDMGGVVKPDHLQQMIYCVTRLLDHRNHSAVRMSAVDALKAFLRAEEGARAVQASRAWIGVMISRHGIDSWSNADEERATTELLVLWAERLVFALESPPTATSAGTFIGSPIADWNVFGAISFLSSPLSLCSIEPANLALAIPMMRRGYAMVRDPGFFAAIGSPRAENGQPSEGDFVDFREKAMPPEGRALLAKKARTLMKFSRVAQARPGVWDEALRRWKVLLSQLGQSAPSGLAPERPHTGVDASGLVSSWISHSLLLVMVASEGGLDSAPYSESANVPIPRDLLPPRFSMPQDRSKQVSVFIREMVDLLVADNLQIREAVKDALGRELGPTLLPLLISHVRTVVACFFEDDRAMPQPPYTHFVEQAVIMLRLVCERMGLPQNEPQLATDVATLFVDLCRYTANLGNAPDGEAAAVRIKYWLTHLCELAVKQRWVEDDNFRNELAHYVLMWAADTTLVPCFTHEELARHRASRDLLLNCLACLAALLRDLPIRPQHIIQRDENGRSYPRTYLRFHEYLASLIVTVAGIEAPLDASVSAATDLPLPGELAQRFVDGELSQMADFRARASACLVELMVANPEQASGHVNDLGFHSDFRARRSLLGVLQTFMERTGDRIIEMICMPDFTLTIAICDVCPAGMYEELSEILLNLFAARGTAIHFLVAVVENEVANTHHESTLFRGNSFATRLLTLFARTRGYDYLRHTLARLLLAVSSKPAEFMIDYDPHGSNPSSGEAVANLEAMTEAFLETIKESWARLPVEIREVCHHIATITERKFPRSMMTAVGGFIFLRLINPSIIAPDGIDLDLPQPARETQRSLIMITRVLQSLANNIRFGATDPSSKTLNDFMKRNMWGMAEFLQNCARAPDPELVAAAISISRSDQPPDGADVHVLHNFIHDHSAALGNHLLTLHTRPQRRYLVAVSNSPDFGSGLWNDLTQAMSELGDPSASEPDLPSVDSSPTDYIQSVASRELLRAPNRKLWKGVFFKAPPSHGRPAFVFLASAVKAATADLEGFILHVVEVLSSSDRPYTLFIDCTHFATSNEIPTSWLRFFFSIVPLHARQNLSDIVFINPNYQSHRYLRKVLGSNKWERHWTSMVNTATDLRELTERLPAYERVLPSGSWRFNEERRAVIGQVVFTHGFQGHTPVRLMIGTKTLLVSSASAPLLAAEEPADDQRQTKPQEFVFETKCKLNEIIDLAEIEEVRRFAHVNPRGHPGFTLRVRSGGTMRFVSPQTDQILHALDPLVVGPGANFVSHHPFPQSTGPAVQGALLNCILQNVCSVDAPTRATAFGLLQEFVKKTDCQGVQSVKNILATGHLPQISSHFLGELSDHLSQALTDATLPMLVNFFATADLASQDELAACGFFLKPWLLKLPDCLPAPTREQHDTNRDTARSILRGLIGLCIHEVALHQLLHARVWPTYARQTETVPLLIDELARTATACGSGATSFTYVCEIGVSASSTELQGKLLARLRKAVLRTSLSPVAHLVESAEWPEIFALARIELGLTFNAPLQVSLFLPEIIYICTMLVGVGPVPHRQTIHALVINTASSLLAAGRGKTDDARLRELADEIAAPSGRLAFGLAPSETSATGSDGMMDVELDQLERVVDILVSILEAAAPTHDTANAWRSRLVGLLTSTSFQRNPALQCRAFTALGHLTATHVEEDFFYQVVAALRPALRATSVPERSLTVSILNCASKLVKGLAPSSSYLATAWWIGIGIMVGADTLVYAAGLRLAKTSVALLVDESLDDPLQHLGSALSAEGCAPALQALDSAAGLRLDCSPTDEVNYFGFSMVALLVKGLRDRQTSRDAETLLRFLMVSSRMPGRAHDGPPGRVEPAALPYFVVLLPIAARQGLVPELFGSVGLDVDSSTEPGQVLEALGLTGTEAAVLVVAVICAMLQTTDSDSETAFCLNLLAAVAESGILPNTMGWLHEDHQSRIYAALQVTGDPQIAASCQTLMFSILDGGAALEFDGSPPRLEAAVRALRLSYLFTDTTFLPATDGDALDREGDLRALCIDLISALLA